MKMQDRPLTGCFDYRTIRLKFAQLLPKKVSSVFSQQ
jgi:hypothetical protein